MKKIITDVDVDKKKVFVRADFNVPLDENGIITDDTRIQKTLPTIRYLLDHQAAVILASHLGRPKGKVVEKYSLKPVAVRLSELLGIPVQMAPDCIGVETEAMAGALQPGQVLLLENLRFHGEEEKNVGYLTYDSREVNFPANWPLWLMWVSMMPSDAATALMRP